MSKNSFTINSAQEKIIQSNEFWNKKNIEKIASFNNKKTEWRDKGILINGQNEVKDFLLQKWQKQLNYKLKIELWGFRKNKMAVQFTEEWKDNLGQWYRTIGNELWEFDENDLMIKRFSSGNDLQIKIQERLL